MDDRVKKRVRSVNVCAVLCSPWHAFSSLSVLIVAGFVVLWTLILILIVFFGWAWGLRYRGWPRPERCGESNGDAVHVLLTSPFSDLESLGLFSVVLWTLNLPLDPDGSLGLRPMYQILGVAQTGKCGRSRVGAVSCLLWDPFSSSSVCGAVCLLVVWTLSLIV